MTDQRFSSDFFGDEEDVRAYARKRISDFFKSGNYPDLNAIDAHQRTAIVVDGAEHLADAIIKKIGAGEPIDLLSLSAALIREFLTKRGFQPGEAKAPSADNLQAPDADPEKALLDASAKHIRAYVRASFEQGLNGGFPKLTENLREEILPLIKASIEALDRIEAEKWKGDAKPLTRITVGQGVDWTTVDGVLADMVRWILDTSPYPNWRMAVMSAFATLSGPTARHLYTPTGLGLGLILAMLARTTAGKDAPLQATAKLLHAAGLGDMSQPAKTFTVSGFEQNIIDSKGACVSYADEIGEALLAKILSKKAASYETLIKTLLMELTGQMDNSAPFPLTKRARQAVKGELPPIQTVPGVMFTLLGASTVARFFDTLSEGNVSDGLLNRTLIIHAGPKALAENKDTNHPIPESVTGALRAIADIGLTGGRQLNQMGCRTYDRARVPWTPEGESRYDQLGREVDGVLRTEPPYEDLYGRIKANSLVLATLRAISRDYDAPMVDAQDIDAGAAMVIESVRTIIVGLADATGGTEYGKMSREIAAYIRGRRTTTAQAIGNAVRGYTRKQRAEVLFDLEELDKVKIERLADKKGELSILPQSTVRWIG